MESFPQSNAPNPSCERLFRCWFGRTLTSSSGGGVLCRIWGRIKCDPALKKGC